MMRSRASESALELTFGAFGAAFLVLAFVFSVTGIPQIPRAPMVMLGIPSPLSGMTRSFVAFASGNVSGSFQWHPLGPIAFIASACAPVVAAASVLRGQGVTVVGRVVADRRFWVATSALVLVSWIRQIAVLG